MLEDRTVDVVVGLLEAEDVDAGVHQLQNDLLSSDKFVTTQARCVPGRNF